MPNTPSATVQEGMAGICAGAHADDSHLALAEDVLGHLGAVVRVPEHAMDAVTAVSGSGPADFASSRSRWSRPSSCRPLPRDLDATRRPEHVRHGEAPARRANPPRGAARERHLPGGTTIRAIRELKRAGVRAAFLNAIQAEMERSRELDEAELSKILVEDDPQARAAELLVAAARAGGNIALCGGSTPGRAYELAAGLGPDWSRAHVWFGTPCRPAEHDDSNFKLVREHLVEALEGQPTVHRIKGELGAALAAEAYDEELRGVALDLILLGIGPDGHTASLFPDAPSLDVDDRRVIGVPGRHPRSARRSIA